MELYKIDKYISEVVREIDFYSHLTPVNCGEERDRFFEGVRRGEQYNPVFHYKARGFEEERKRLDDIRSSLDESDDIQRLFIKKIDFIVTQLELLDSDDSCFADIAVRLYGKPGASCLKTAEDILYESKDSGYAFPEETVTPEEMASFLRGRLKEKGIDWTVVLSGKIVPKITVSGKDRTIYINSGINYTAEEVERLKVHEVDVHICRGANGDTQPFDMFREGLAGYDETEEGLAILAEKSAGCLKVDTRQMKLYAGRALCVDYCLGGTFHEAFMKLREFFPGYLTYRLVERCKRGLRDTAKRGGFTKDFHYISGFEKVRKYVEDGGDLSILYVGKIGLDDVEVVRSLLEKGILNPPKYLPEFIGRVS